MLSLGALLDKETTFTIRQSPVSFGADNITEIKFPNGQKIWSKEEICKIFEKRTKCEGKVPPLETYLKQASEIVNKAQEFAQQNHG